MDDSQRLRYSRHLLLNEFGEAAQEQLLASRALIVGAGGLGSAAALYLASAGVGHITIADGDTVDATNLQRQIAHTESRVGMQKAESVKIALFAINSTITVDALNMRLVNTALDTEIAKADIILDCSDNFETRHAINSSCVKFKKPLVSGAAIRFDGQLSFFDLRRKDAPCYHCLFPDTEENEEDRCATMGVFAPLVGIVGAAQAALAITALANLPAANIGQLHLLHGLSLQWNTVRYKRDPACAVCAVRRAV
jgi:molybdopterin-synthase adenylyltransferase